MERQANRDDCPSRPYIAGCLLEWSFGDGEEKNSMGAKTVERRISNIPDNVIALQEVDVGLIDKKV
jgi:hypothetical protein